MTFGFYTDSALILGSAGTGHADFTLDLDPDLYDRFIQAEAEYYRLSAEIMEIRKQKP